MLVDLVDKLVDRLIQLIRHRQQVRLDLLKDHVTPVFAAFEAVHAQYLSSFSRYRQMLKTSGDPLTTAHPLIDTLRTDNLFTEHERTKILGLGGAIDDPELGAFVRLIRDYVVDVRVADDPMAGYRGRRFTNPQHWRRTLIAELEAIFDERWQIVLDPNAARPPLYGAELEEALANARREARIEENDPRQLDKLKQAFAVGALDDIVGDMQEAYGAVASEYGRLQRVLSGNG
jgi:hypothetical protein